MEVTATDRVQTLASVEQQFATWRSNSKKHERIPAHLWQSATELCAAHPITHVCKRLRLSFNDLKKRLAQIPGDIFVDIRRSRGREKGHPIFSQKYAIISDVAQEVLCCFVTGGIPCSST